MAAIATGTAAAAATETTTTSATFAGLDRDRHAGAGARLAIAAVVLAAATHLAVAGAARAAVPGGDAAGMSAPSRPGLPDGRLEVLPVIGWAVFDRALALQSGFWYGGEIAHHFHLRHPWVSLGAYASVEGSLSELVTPPNNDVDVIVISGGMTYGLRGLGRFLPIARIGAGLFVGDGTPGGLDIIARLQFHAGLGVRYYLLDWIVLRAEVRAMTHENLQLGAGSGEITNVWHWILSGGVGIAR